MRYKTVFKILVFVMIGSMLLSSIIIALSSFL